MGETNRFNATLGVVNAPQATQAWPYIQAGQPVPEPLRTAVGDYIGAGNYWITNQASFVPVGYVKQGDNFVPAGGPTPPPTDQFADLKWRQANVGSWAAFSPLFFVESNALKAAYPTLVPTINQLNNYYGPGGYGNVFGYRNGNLFTFDNFITGQWEPDVNHACDNFILNQPGNPQHIAPPVLVIP